MGIVGSLKSARGGADANRILDRPLQPLSRSLLRVAAGLSLLLIAVVLNALLHSSEDPLNPIAEAAARTQHAPGARMTIVAVYSSPASTRTITATGDGVYNAQSGRSRVELEVPSELSSERIVTVGNERSYYLRSPRIAEGLPPGRPWMEVQPWLGRSASSALASHGTGSELEMLRAVGEGIESLGQATVRGVSTERYRGTVSLARYADLLSREGKADSATLYRRLATKMPGPIPVEAWIDQRGMLRRYRTVMTLSEPGHPPIEVDMRFDLYDFGIAPKISLPDSQEVFDTTPIVKAELHLLGNGSSNLPQPSGPALPAARFNREASTICRQAKQRLRGLKRKEPSVVAAAKADAARARAHGASPQQALRVYGVAAGRYFNPVLRLGSRLVRQLGRLASPAGKADTYRRFVSATALSVERVEAISRALEAGDLALAKRLINRPRSGDHRSDRLAAQLGLHACVGGAGASPAARGS
ncbi:MAG TPA: hypothetical protein VF731_04240 [Solirubrobacterales bacterium]